MSGAHPADEPEDISAGIQPELKIPQVPAIGCFGCHGRDRGLAGQRYRLVFTAALNDVAAVRSVRSMNVKRLRGGHSSPAACLLMHSSLPLTA